MATISGTGADDFIHMTGDGHSPPMGYNEITGVTNSGDTIDPGAGTDIVYCGSGDDTILVNDIADIAGFAESLDGGGGVSDLLRIMVGGSLDLTSATIVDVERLLLPSVTVELTLTAAQFSSFDVIAATGTDDHRLILAAPGDVTMTAPNASLSNISSVDGSSGDDTFLIVASGSNIEFFGNDGHDVISFTYRPHIPQNPLSFTLDGGTGNDELTGKRAFFNLFGGDGDDKLTGWKFDDTVEGGRGKDKIVAGAGHDDISGGGGKDTFVFKEAADTKLDHPDLIRGFAQGADTIDLATIDADTETGGDQAFFLGGSSFTGAAGELIQFIEDGRTILQGDTDGDEDADFAIRLNGAPVLTGDDFAF